MIEPGGPDLRMVAVFFVYGLAFFAMGLAIALQTRRRSPLALASGLWFLAGFGLLHSLADWMDMFILIQAQPLDTSPLPVLRALRLALVAAAGLLLMLFGLRALRALHPSARWLYVLPPAAVAAWLLTLALPHLSMATTPGLATGLCWDCHGTRTESYVAASQEWVTGADAWAHYLFDLPGSLLAALALLGQYPLLRRARLERVGLDCRLAAIAFVLSGLISGLVVAPAPYFPASILNYASFSAVVGVPPQILRVVAALAIAFFVGRILRIFELEQHRQLERAQQERFRVQQEALEAQQQAQQQVEALYAEVRHKEEMRGQLLEKVISAQEEERKRIARELHDEVGQALTALVMTLAAAEEALLPEQQTERKRLADIRALTLQTLDEIHKLMLDLRPTLLDDLGLTPALRWYAKNCQERWNLEVHLHIEGLRGRLPAQIETVIFRIVQEALTNVAKHAQARQVHVSLQRRNGTVSTAVEDDGRGFDPQEVRHNGDRGRGLGLMGMQERAALLGGRVAIETKPGQGTRVQITIPVAEEEAHE